jgi:hypothetical protein
VTHQAPGLDESTRVQQQLDTFAGKQLPCLALFSDPFRASAIFGSAAATEQLFEVIHQPTF